jgi:hypothetical protein
MSRLFTHLGRLTCALSLLALASAPASAFPHVAQTGETLASLSSLYYGRVQFERVLSAANALDGTNTRGLTPGMILEIPAVTYRQVHSGDTWKSLAKELLGAEHRYILLAQTNGHKPWLEPEIGQLIAVPYNLSWLATGQESLATLAYRFLGSTKNAFLIVQYNELGERELERGEVLLLPLSELPLTGEGRAAAERAAAQITEQSRGDQFQAQKKSKAEAKSLEDDVREGRYVAAVARGTQLLAEGKLSQPARASVHFQLLESYVALEEQGLARTACESFRSLSPSTVLDPYSTSPKILRVCPAPANRPPSIDSTDDEKSKSTTP